MYQNHQVNSDSLFSGWFIHRCYDLLFVALFKDMAYFRPVWWRHALTITRWMNVEYYQEMTDPQQTPTSAEEELHVRQENKKRIIRFVSIFVVTTLVLLTAYRYAIHTRINDWYLFQAAKHTTMALDTIGYARLEPLHYGKYDARKTRASIKAWREGREGPDEQEIAEASPAPLTPWERWSYRAFETRRSEEPRINGPRVYFVLRQGISTEIDAVLGEINYVESLPELTEKERAERLAPLKEKLQALRQRQQAIRANPDSEEKDTSLTFPFILIPECGAIEIMAIFLAAVLAFPTTWWRRLIGIAAGLPIMYFVNIFRLTVLAVIGAVDKSRVWFNFAHEYVWQAIYIIFVVAVWLIWVEYIVKRRTS